MFEKNTDDLKYEATELNNGDGLDFRTASEHLKPYEEVKNTPLQTPEINAPPAPLERDQQIKLHTHYVNLFRRAELLGIADLAQLQQSDYDQAA